MQSLEVYEKQFQAGEISWWDLTKKVMSHSIEAGIATANTMFPLLKCPEGMSCAGIPIGPPSLNAPQITMGEIKSINSAAGLKQLAGRTHGTGNTALVVYDNEGNVFMQVFQKAADGIMNILGRKYRKNRPV
jgi:hypothetical protein